MIKSLRFNKFFRLKGSKENKESTATIKYVFRKLLWPRKWLLLLGLVLILFNRLAGLVLPGSSKFLIDNVIQKGDTSLLSLLLLALDFRQKIIEKL